MNITSRFLAVGDVALGLDVRDKKHALEVAALMLERHHRIDGAPVFRALWRREQVGSTALGHGIAIPHARITRISEPILLLMSTKMPIDFNAPDRKPVSVIFVILVPEHANDEYLGILACVSEMFSDRAFRRRLHKAKEAGEAQRLFSKWGRKEAFREVA